MLFRSPGLIWVQMATVGLEWTEHFANTAARHGVSFFDAPVSGSQGPAEAGELTILASGPAWMHDAVAPVFAALGRATAWLGPAGNGTRAKLVEELAVDLHHRRRGFAGTHYRQEANVRGHGRHLGACPTRPICSARYVRPGALRIYGHHDPVLGDHIPLELVPIGMFTRHLDISET